MKPTSKFCSIVLTISLMGLVLSGAVAVALLWRGFYFLHIAWLDLPGQTGYSVAEIRDAFNEMMDYCVLDAPFGTGVLKWSQDGYAHFADCQWLFRLDFTVLAVALAMVLLLMHMRKDVTFPRLAGRGPMFWAGSVLAGSFVVIAGLAALNFDRAFVVFHTLFFPGKSNWIFDAQVDEIIRILPQAVFRDYAVLIVGLLFAGCIAMMVADGKRKNTSELPR